ncbi:LysR family transcriptional regulator [Arabiibacter massiliensis]|uniref:LysR family transcriptional regulator n=1 Tax=Arabiibacter massiliensis TaxID=1870985 RepID=UPI00155A519A|nr:LysR family transcriptional regulator [Arabiibacter massiliensis]
METAYLKEYLAFSRTLNYAQAASELFVSQPALRAHIRALEDEVGAPLTVKRNGALATWRATRCCWAIRRTWWTRAGRWPTTSLMRA